MILTFLGFIIFLGSILNKINNFFWIVDKYYVLFLLFGIVVSTFGLVNMMIWNFKNKTPFFDIEQSKPRLHFVPYLEVGMFMILGGFTTIHYIKKIKMGMYIISMSSSIIGILIMLYGLKFFIKEVYNPSQKSSSHS